MQRVQCGYDGCRGSCRTASNQAPSVAHANVERRGESCNQPFEISHGLGVFYANGDTSNASPDVTHSASDCGFLGTTADGPDHVYAFNVEADGTYTITLGIANEGVDLALWIATDCDDPGNTCIGGSDVPNFGEGEEVVTFDALAGERYYIVVDSFYTDGGPESGPIP